MPGSPRRRVIVLDVGPMHALVEKHSLAEKRVPYAEQLRVDERVHPHEEFRLNHRVLRDDLVHLLQRGHAWGVLRQIHAPRAQRLSSTIPQGDYDRRVGVG